MLKHITETFFGGHALYSPRDDRAKYLLDVCRNKKHVLRE